MSSVLRGVQVHCFKIKASDMTIGFKIKESEMANDFMRSSRKMVNILTPV